MPDNPARFYTRLPEGAVRCDLCPRRCVITPGGAGWCRMRCNAAGELHALSYARRPPSQSIRSRRNRS